GPRWCDRGRDSRDEDYGGGDDGPERRRPPRGAIRVADFTLTTHGNLLGGDGYVARDGGRAHSPGNATPELQVQRRDHDHVEHGRRDDAAQDHDGHRLLDL